MQSGDNDFTFANTVFPINPFFGIGLFFNDTGDPFVSTTQVAGDLLTVSPSDGSPGFSFPAPGASVGGYRFDFTTTNYSGATTFDVGNAEITVTDVVTDNSAGGPTGTFTVNVDGGSGFGDFSGGVVDGINFFTVPGYDGTNSGADLGVDHFVFDPDSDSLYHDNDSAQNGYQVVVSIQPGVLEVTAGDIEVVAV